MKIKYLTFSILLFCLIISFSIKAQSFEDDLLIYYSFDSTISDQSGNGFDPNYYRFVYTEDRQGSARCAAYFNGIDNYIELPESILLQPPFPLSIALWIKLDNLNPENTVIFYNDFNEFTASGAWLNVGISERLAINFGNGWGFYPTARKTFYTDLHLVADKWYFVTAVFKNRFDLRIFINGEEQNGFLDGSAEDMVYVGGIGNIGRGDANYQLDPYYYKGILDEFRYWSRGLTNQEVKLLYDEETLQVNEFENQTFKIYPNPTKDWINIEFFHETEYELKVINQYGKLLDQSINTKRLNVGAFPAGLYIFTATTKDGTQFFQKIIKQ